MLKKKHLILGLIALFMLVVGVVAQQTPQGPDEPTPTSMSNVQDRPVPTSEHTAAPDEDIPQELTSESADGDVIPTQPTSSSNVIDRAIPTSSTIVDDGNSQGSQGVPTAPTSMSNVLDQPIPTLGATSQSNVEDRAIPTEPTSLSNVEDQPVPRADVTSQSNVEDRVIPQNTAEETAETPPSTGTSPPESTASSSTEPSATEVTGAMSDQLTPASPDRMDYQISALNPQGDIAENISNLFWLLLAIATPIYIYVIGLVLYTVFSRRRHSEAEQEEETEDQPNVMRFVLINSVVMPAGILLIVFALTLWVINATSPSARETALTIEVHGEQWWWDIRYPQHDIVTANEIQIPAGEAVRIELRSDNVIHSFWVPELAGKMDLIPGAENNFWIHADESGVYRGKCAEFCGTQHANMQFLVVALPPADFDQWVADQQQVAASPQSDTAIQGQEIFVSAGCAGCHAIQGFDQAPGGVGPDLTHLASRRSIAAGILPNTRGHLGGWISNPQGIKPGNQMPSVSLDGEELQALLDYLQMLE